jgi:insulin-like growth factor 2 mRNA-binding protein 1
VFLSLSSSSAKIVISNIPNQAIFDDIEPLLKPFGRVEHVDAVGSKDPNSQTVYITFENHEQALK